MEPAGTSQTLSALEALYDAHARAIYRYGLASGHYIPTVTILLVDADPPALLTVSVTERMPAVA